jgi:DNA-binding XRE family transcriptional regulator
MLISLGVNEVLKSKLRIRLAELEIKQKDLAEELGVTKQTLSGWVTGSTNPVLGQAFMLAKRLDCKVDDLWVYEEE